MFVSINFICLSCYGVNGKNCTSVLVLIYKQCFNFLNNIVSTLFRFALAFSMVQVSTSHSCKHKKMDKKIIVWPKNSYIWLENHINPARYSSNRGKVKHGLLVTSYELHPQVTRSNPRVTSSNLRVTSSNPRFQIYELRVQINELRVQIYKLEH